MQMKTNCWFSHSSMRTVDHIQICFIFVTSGENIVCKCASPKHSQQLQLLSNYNELCHHDHRNAGKDECVSMHVQVD